MIKKKGVFVVFTHASKRLSYSGEVEVVETVNIVDKVNKTMWLSATAIINVLECSLEKTRSEEVTYDFLMKHFKLKYPKQRDELTDFMKKRFDFDVVYPEGNALGATEPAEA